MSNTIQRTAVLTGATSDRGIGITTARRYANGTYVEIPASDHLVFHGAALPVTMARIDEWMAQHKVLACG